MKVRNYKEYALFDYLQNPPFSENKYNLGDVVINDNDEIGVIIQIHDRANEYRTDMFGNCCDSEITLAKKSQIEKIRPNLNLEYDNEAAKL